MYCALTDPLATRKVTVRSSVARLGQGDSWKCSWEAPADASGTEAEFRALLGEAGFSLTRVTATAGFHRLSRASPYKAGSSHRVG